MSAANRGSARIDNDHYPTPEWCVDALLAELRTDMRGLIYAEPCRAEGAIYNKLPKPKVWAEIRHGRDYLVTPLPADVVITNPIFLLAEAFIRKSLKEARAVFYLLRLNFLGGQERKKFWQEVGPPTHLFILSKRPAFVSVCRLKGCGAKYPLDYTGRCDCGGSVGIGTDATEYAWFAWDGLDICKQRPGIYWI